MSSPVGAILGTNQQPVIKLYDQFEIPAVGGGVVNSALEPYRDQIYTVKPGFRQLAANRQEPGVEAAQVCVYQLEEPLKEGVAFQLLAQAGFRPKLFIAQLLLVATRLKLSKQNPGPGLPLVSVAAKRSLGPCVAMVNPSRLGLYLNANLDDPDGVWIPGTLIAGVWDQPVLTPVKAA